MSKNQDALIQTVIDNYFGSTDFNGYPFQESPDETRAILKPLIEQELIAARYGDLDVNPHIRPFSDPPVHIQLRMLEDSNLSLVVLYPTKKILARSVKASDYGGRPFTLELALGHGQLDFRCFDLSILEIYRNDPRYYYEATDMFGAIYSKDDNTPALPESDQVFLKTFGFGYDTAMNRCVVVFLRYLHDLTPEHQQVWNSKLLVGSFKIHPDYRKSAIGGEWIDHAPILDAFGAELHHINEMCKLMGKPPLFRNTFYQERKPKGFTFLIRPTKKEFDDFIHLLDKALSDNLNKDFFKGDIDFEEEVPRKDGKIEVRQIGTIRLLENWLNRYWTPKDPKPLRDALMTFREIRKLRQDPAHIVKENEFDQMYFKHQRDLIIRAYEGIRGLRLLFSQHPKVKGLYNEVEEELFEGKIRTY